MFDRNYADEDFNNSAEQRNNNGNQRRDGRKEPVRVLRSGNNCVIFVENLSSEEEQPDKEKVVDHGNQHNHDYRVKDDIPLFYETMAVDEFLNWQIDVDRFFDVIGILENKKVKMVVIGLKSIYVFWWDKLVLHRQWQRKGLVRSW
ncbi:hypothetical protein KIW84_066358 [Lathyrus oleraceus]|uniref:Uncharacterized protein n=1 Tax=Pisum sativum TaxID=3888 RepID=A0A9D4WFK4_PEA|nr:hypothetical protein KIW84_066358 [Pisum sativum]